MLNCAHCTALIGRDATVDPHVHLVSGGVVALFDSEIKAYQCSQCGTEWGVVLSGGSKTGHWIRRTGAEPAKGRGQPRH